MIKVELGHLGVTFDCKLSLDPYNKVWHAHYEVNKSTIITGKGKSPALAIEALRNKFHEEEK